MKLFKMLVITTLLTMGLTGQSVLADDEREIPIVGLWEGIDPDDGVFMMISKMAFVKQQ